MAGAHRLPGLPQAIGQRVVSRIHACEQRVVADRSHLAGIIMALVIVHVIVRYPWHVAFAMLGHCRVGAPSGRSSPRENLLTTEISIADAASYAPTPSAGWPTAAWPLAGCWSPARSSSHCLSSGRCCLSTAAKSTPPRRTSHSGFWMPGDEQSNRYVTFQDSFMLKSNLCYNLGLRVFCATSATRELY